MGRGSPEFQKTNRGNGFDPGGGEPIDVDAEAVKAIGEGYYNPGEKQEIIGVAKRRGPTERGDARKYKG